MKVILSDKQVDKYIKKAIKVKKAKYTKMLKKLKRKEEELIKDFDLKWKVLEEKEHELKLEKRELNVKDKEVQQNWKITKDKAEEELRIEHQHEILEKDGEIVELKAELEAKNKMTKFYEQQLTQKGLVINAAELKGMLIAMSTAMSPKGKINKIRKISAPKSK